MYCHIETVFRHTLFTQDPSMMEAECQERILLIYLGIFVSFENIVCRLFHLVFTKNFS